MRFSFLIIILLLSSTALYTQSKLDSLVSIGNEQSFQFQFKQANNTFETIIKNYPESSLGYYFISRNSLWFYMANKDSVSKKRYLENIVIAKTKGELEYDNFPENEITNTNLGNIFFLESIYNSTEQNSMDAFWATKSAVNYFEDAIEYNPIFFEPYLPLGTIKYALGFVPGFLGWAISLTGLEGKKNKGLNNIRIAYQNCSNCKTEAAYHLGKIYTEYNAMYDSAEVVLSKIVEDYPNNELFLYQYAILKIDKKELKQAKEILNRILFEIKENKFKQTYALSFFLKGELLFKQNEFHQSIVEYEQFIMNSSTPDYTGIANLKIALSYEMLNKKLKAQKHYILARNGNPNIAEDSFADSESKKYYDYKFSNYDKYFIRGKNLFECGKYSEALEVLQKIESSNIGLELQFKVNIVKIESYQELGNFQKSLMLLGKYEDNSVIKEFSGYAKFLYLNAYQKFNEKKYSISKEKLDLAFEKIDENNNKLNRLLINLSLKITKSIK